MEARQRGNYGQGSITARKDGRFRVRIPTERGPRDFYAKTKAEARKLQRTKLAERHEGNLARAGTPTMKVFFEEWLASVESKVKYSTHLNYALNAKRLTPLLGKIKVGDLKPADIERAKNKLLAPGLSAKSVAQALATLHTALEHAVDMELIARNPAKRVNPPKRQAAEMSVLCAEQLVQLFDGTRSDRFHALWVVLGMTGLRLGEALGLKWADINLEHGTITIRRALQFQAGRNMVEVSTKTEGSRATLHADQDVIEALRQHAQRQRFEGVSTSPTAYVFTSEVGTPPVPCTVLRALHRALAKLGLPLIRVHDLRHGVATLLTQAGLPTIVIQAYMRHSSPAQTMHYSHLTAGMGELPAATMHSLLEAARQTVPA